METQTIQFVKKRTAENKVLTLEFGWLPIFRCMRAIGRTAHKWEQWVNEQEEYIDLVMRNRMTDKEFIEAWLCDEDATAEIEKHSAKT